MNNLRILKRIPQKPHALFVTGLRFLTVLAAALFIAGCATKPAKKTFTFFPPPPDEPRVQFLTSFSSDADLGWNSKFAEFVTGKAQPEIELIKPYGVAIREGKVFVCDTMAAAVVVFDLVRQKSSYFSPQGAGRLQTPINITIDTDGTRYVADSGRGQVLVYRNDEFLTAIGMKDEMRPTDVAVAADRLYITDLKAHVVRVHSKADQKLLFTIPRDPKTAERKLLSPTNLALDSQGRLLVSDTGAFAVQVYDREGNYVQTIGKQGVAPGLFARPKGIAADKAGRAYIVDAATQLVQIFGADGKLLMFFGQPETSAQGDLHLPAAVRLDYDNVRLFDKNVAPGYKCEYLILVTSQVGNRKLNVYGFLTPARKAE